MELPILHWAIPGRLELTFSRDLAEKFGSLSVGAYTRVEHISADDTYIRVVCPAVVAFTVSLDLLELPGPDAKTGSTCTYTEILINSVQQLRAEATRRVGSVVDVIKVWGKFFAPTDVLTSIAEQRERQ